MRVDVASARKPRLELTVCVVWIAGNTADGSAKLKNLLGGKGANLAEMVPRLTFRTASRCDKPAFRLFAGQAGAPSPGRIHHHDRYLYGV